LKEAEGVLARHGGRVEQMPSRWRRTFGSAPDYKVCVNRGGRWTVTNRWL